MLEISADPAAEGLPRGVGDDRRYQKDSRGDGESLFPENKPGEELRKENGRPNATYREGYRSQRNELPYNGAGRSEHTYPHREGSGNRRNENPRDHNLRNGTFQRSDSRGPQRNFQQNAYANRRRPAPTIRIGAFSIGYLRGLEYLISRSQIDGFCGRVVDFNQSPLYLNEVLDKSNDDLADFASSIDLDEASSRAKIIDNCMESALAEGRPIVVKGILESMEGGDGIITYACDSYKIRAKSTFVPRCLIQSLGLRRGQTLSAFVHPPMEQSTCPFAIKISDVLGKLPEEAIKFPRFKDLTPYYPTERIFLENKGASANDSLSMRIIDLLSPIGFGQRGLIVAPPKTGKTVLLQGMANAIIHNQPGTKLVVLLIDERPEEVTDFLRQVRGAEVISSTFDESAESHIHAAEIVIESARRWVEAGENVVILLDSITRLARAYNTEQPSSGKILSGGVEANALQLPKRFFGSARNIEGGGSLTIIATALIETGSRMDDVIFEEFKGTGNMELHLDRAISDRRIFPAINLERSGTRKEELLYHPDELAKIYNLRRAFQDISGGEAMEMLVSRLKRCANNVEFLMHMNR
ncbi:MAG: transcription termination factor Rho [Puniceicoccales bacterium]|nr:transcription termination factor Rho [Puniceicoccales bacterium]